MFCGEEFRMIRIGVIGAGGRGRVSRLAHKPSEGSGIVAVCDPVGEVHREYREKVSEKIVGYFEWREMLDKEKLDAVFVCAPDWLHEEMAVGALERGLGVYLEKPMAITLEGADRILRVWRENERKGAKLFVGHNLRFYPVFRKMKEIIDSGRIGQVQAVWCRHFINYGGDAYFKDWHSERKFATGLLLQKGAHDIDIIHWLGGAPTKRVVGMGMLSVYDKVKDRRPAEERGNAKFERANWPPLEQKGMSPVIDVEDHSMMLMQLANGVQGNYVQCHYTPDACRNYTVIGTEGRIENCGDTSGAENEAVVRIWDRRVGYLENGTESISIPGLVGSHGGADVVIVADFLKYLRTGERSGASPMDARNSVAAGYLATVSMRSGNVPYDVPATT
jgi:predicted dehydrogenase